MVGSAAYSQEWNLFKNQETYHFNESDIHSLKVDSIQSNLTDTIYYFNEIINDTIYNNHYNSFIDTTQNLGKPNLFGRSVLKCRDSLFISNQNGQSILLLEKATLNQSWTFLKDSHFVFIAKIDSIYTDSLNGIIDSLKRVKFLVYDSSGTLVNHYVSKFNLILSKNNGLIKTLNLYHFPNHIYINHYAVSFQRIFYSIAKTRGEMYDFDIGDEYHLTSNEFSSGGFSLFPTDYINATILSKRYSANADTIFYTQGIKKEINTATVDYSTSPPTIVFQTSYMQRIDSFFVTQLTNPFSYYLGNGVNPSISSNTVPIYKYSKSIYNNRLKIEQNPMFFYDSSRFHSWMFGSAEYTYINIEGVCYYSDRYWSTGGSQVSKTWYDLIYFKKGTETWGTPRVVTAIEAFENRIDNPVNIYPNPTKGMVNIETSLKIKTVIIYNAQGQTIKEIKNPTSQFELPKARGIYFLRIETDSGKIIKQKIIKT